MKSVKRHKYKYFPLELIKIFLRDTSLRRPVFKHRRDLVKNRGMADLSTPSHCIYEPVGSSLDVRYGTFIKSSLFVSSFHISESLHSAFLRALWIILTPPSRMSASHARVYRLRKVLPAKMCPLCSIKRLSQDTTHLAGASSPVYSCPATSGEDAFIILTVLGRKGEHFSKTHCTALDSAGFPLTSLLLSPRDLIKKFLVIDRARRLGNMKVSWLGFPSPWTAWQLTTFHTFSR